MEPKEVLVKARVLISNIDIMMLLLLTTGERLKFGLLSKLKESRNAVVLKIGKAKKELGLPIHCPARESEELKRLQKFARMAHLPISPAEIESFFQDIFIRSRELQNDSKN